MKQLMILIAVMAMSALTIQANEVQPETITVSSADAAAAPTEAAALTEEDANTTEKDADKS